MSLFNILDRSLADESYQLSTIVTMSYILVSLEKKGKLGAWSLCTFFASGCVILKYKK